MSRKSVARQFLLCLLVALSWPVAASAQSVWETVKSSGKLRVCVVTAGTPYSEKDATGRWHGLMVTMGEDLAKQLKVEAVEQETTWGTAVLDIQSNKCDVMFGLNPTPNRWEAVDFAGPLWKFSYTLVVRKDLDAGDTWEDYNKPNITLSVIQGTADEEAARRYAPKAKILTFSNLSEAVLAVQSHRADALVSTALSAVMAHQRNPAMGNFVQVKPEYGLPAYAVVRKDGDGRFREYLNHWAEYNRDLGNIELWIKDSLASVGVEKDDIPKAIHFY